MMNPSSVFADQFTWHQPDPQEILNWSYGQAATNAERHDCSDATWDLINQIYTLTEASVL
jgi:hypothetical protein